MKIRQQPAAIVVSARIMVSQLALGLALQEQKLGRKCRARATYPMQRTMHGPKQASHIESSTNQYVKMLAHPSSVRVDSQTNASIMDCI